MIQLKRAAPSDRETIHRLWRAEFEDEPAFIDRFCAWCGLEQVFLLWEDGVPRCVCAAPLVEVTLPDGGRARTGYLYALTTDRAARGGGFGRMMLRYVDFCLRNQGADGALLVPAQPSLFGFFASVDYQPAFSLEERTLRTGELPALETGAVRPSEPAEYRSIREERLAGLPHMISPLGLLDQQKTLCRGLAGDLYRLDLPGGPGCAAAERLPDGSVLCRELLIPDGDVPAALALLRTALDAPAYTVRLPAAGRESRPFGAAKWYRPSCAQNWGRLERGYLGLALD